MLTILEQCAAGIAHLHSHSVTHRDIRADNVLVYSRDPFRLRVADFGLAHVIKDGDLGISQTETTIGPVGEWLLIV